MLYLIWGSRGLVRHPQIGVSLGTPWRWWVEARLCKERLGELGLLSQTQRHLPLPRGVPEAPGPDSARRGTARAPAAARETPCGPKARARPCASGVSQGRGTGWWGIPLLKGRYSPAEQVQMHFSGLPGRFRKPLAGSSPQLFLLARAATCQHKSLLACPSACEHKETFALPSKIPLNTGEKSYCIFPESTQHTCDGCHLPVAPSVPLMVGSQTHAPHQEAHRASEEIALAPPAQPSPFFCRYNLNGAQRHQHNEHAHGQ